MKEFPVVWRPLARNDLLSLYDWIAERATGDVALAYTSRIEAHAAKLASFPNRGTPRNDLVQGMRTVHYRRRTVIAYRVRDDSVEILRLVRAGQDWSNVEFGSDE